MFSDFHACDEIDRRSLGRYTYADFDGRTYDSLSLALRDKARFSVTERGVGVELGPGLVASDRLNVVFGSRSSGKTHLLDRIRATYDPDEVMYIRQFEIVRDADEMRFKALLSEETAREQAAYLHELDALMEYVGGLQGRDECRRKTSEYLKRLRSCAETVSREDEFSKCPLFRFSPLPEVSAEKLERVAAAVVTLLEDESLSLEIENLLGRAALVGLLGIAVARYKEAEVRRRCRREANNIARSIKDLLTVRSSRPSCPVAEFDDVARREVAVSRLADFRDGLALPLVIESQRVGGFTREVRRVPFRNVNELKKDIGTLEKLSGTLALLSREYVERILETGCDRPGSAFFRFDVRLRNVAGQDVSGGQRAEYLLLKKIEDARAYDIVLIDEPESSFDNPFLSEEVNSLIKRMAENSVVFLATHNNALGVSIGANGLVYTAVDGDGRHEVYCGDATAETLVSASGATVRRDEALLDHMEAGGEAYKRRAPYYGHSVS